MAWEDRKHLEVLAIKYQLIIYHLVLLIRIIIDLMEKIILLWILDIKGILMIMGSKDSHIIIQL